jgi:peptide/nickel transport system substrate-binding protein
MRFVVPQTPVGRSGVLTRSADRSMRPRRAPIGLESCRRSSRSCGRLSRSCGRLSRSLLALAGALGVMLIVCGCGSSSSNKSGTFAVTATTPAATGPVSSVTWGDGYGEPLSLDPARSYNPPENSVLANMCESLLRLHPDFTIGPGLAESFSHPSPNIWVYDLRPNVRFWNGAALTPSDVIYSIMRNLDPKVGSFWEVWAKNIASVRQSGPSQVTLTTKTPNLLTNDLLATGLGIVSDADYVREKGAAYGTPKGGLMCTGPFKLSSWSPGNNITLIRNEHYWNPSEAAKSEKFVFDFITNETTLTEGLLSGQLQGAYNVAPEAISKLAASSTGKLYFGPSLRNYSLFPTSIAGPLRDVRVREALSLALDRQGIASAVFDGHAEPLLWAVPRDTFGYARNVFETGYAAVGVNPTPKLEEAKKLVAAAGHPKGTIVIAAQAGETIGVDMATDAASAAKQVGLNASVRELPPAQFGELFFSSKARAGLNFFAATDGYSDVAEPLETVVEAATKEAQYNVIDVVNPEIDSAVEAALGETNLENRAHLAVKALDAWSRQYTLIPMVSAPERLYLSNALTGPPVSFTANIYAPWAASIGAAH